jgi:hypothetical protein
MPGVRFSIRETDRGWQEITRILETLKQRKSFVKAGVLGSAAPRDGISNVDLAMIHEFGAPKAGIPERSFIRSAFDRGRSGYIELLAKFIRRVYERRMTIEQALGLAGLQMATDMKKGVTAGAGIPPPNKEATIKAKGSSRPLVDTGRLVDSISWEVKLEGGD